MTQTTTEPSAHEAFAHNIPLVSEGVMSVVDGKLAIRFEEQGRTITLSRNQVEAQTLAPERLAFLNAHSPTPPGGPNTSTLRNSDVSNELTASGPRIPSDDELANFTLPTAHEALDWDIRMTNACVMSMSDAGQLLLTCGEVRKVVSRSKVESQTERPERLAFLNAHAPAPSGGPDASAPSNDSEYRCHMGCTTLPTAYEAIYWGIGSKSEGVMNVSDDGQLLVKFGDVRRLFSRPKVESQTHRPERLAFLNAHAPGRRTSVGHTITNITRPTIGEAGGGGVRLGLEGVMSVSEEGDLDINFGTRAITVPRSTVEEQTGRPERLAFLNAHAPAPSGGPGAPALSNADVEKIKADTENWRAKLVCNQLHAPAPSNGELTRYTRRIVRETSEDFGYEVGAMSVDVESDELRIEFPTHRAILTREEVESQTTRPERLAFLNAGAPAPSNADVETSTAPIFDQMRDAIGTGDQSLMHMALTELQRVDAKRVKLAREHAQESDEYRERLNAALEDSDHWRGKASEAQCKSEVEQDVGKLEAQLAITETRLKAALEELATLRPPRGHRLTISRYGRVGTMSIADDGRLMILWDGLGGFDAVTRVVVERDAAEYPERLAFLNSFCPSAKLIGIKKPEPPKEAIDLLRELLDAWEQPASDHWRRKAIEAQQELVNRNADIKRWKELAAERLESINDHVATIELQTEQLENQAATISSHRSLLTQLSHTLESFTIS